MSAVEDELSPSFSSSRVTSTSLPSTRNALTPRAPAVAASVRAKTRNVPAWLPFVIHCFEPLSRQPSPSAHGRRAQRAGVRPRVGLGERERADHPPARERRERTARCCSSVPNARIGSVAALVCTATVTPTPASARESSSSTRMYERKSAPAASELLRHAHAHQPELAQLREHVAAGRCARGPSRRRAGRSRRRRTRGREPGWRAARG